MTEHEKEYRKKWLAAHPGYYTEYKRKWCQEHREQHNETCRNYQRRHKEDQRKRMKDYHETKAGRATNLLAAYIQMDLEKHGVRPFLNQEDIIRKCFEPESKCVYCGKTDWKELGLDRIDNDKPHDRWNTVCCCRSCNSQRHRKSLGEYITIKGMSWQEFMERNGMTYAAQLKIEYNGSQIEQN